MFACDLFEINLQKNSHKNRAEGGINHEKAPFAKDCKAMKDLSEIVDFIKPTAIIGKQETKRPGIWNSRIHGHFLFLRCCCPRQDIHHRNYTENDKI
jgi:hypothetical protein